MTDWFDRKAGAMVSIGSEDIGDPTTLLIHEPGAMPDWVRTPPELAEHIGLPPGEQKKLKCLRAFAAPCPLCIEARKANNSPLLTTASVVSHYECEGELFVAECQTHGFSWYRKRT